MSDPTEDNRAAILRRIYDECGPLLRDRVAAWVRSARAEGAAEEAEKIAKMILADAQSCSTCHMHVNAIRQRHATGQSQASSPGQTGISGSIEERRCGTDRRAKPGPKSNVRWIDQTALHPAWSGWTQEKAEARIREIVREEIRSIPALVEMIAWWDHKASKP